MDAVRVQDGLPVMLKRVFPSDGPHELTIIRQFSSPEMSEERRNHCVLLLGIVELGIPEHQKLMVFPLLRPFNSPLFQTFGEFIAFFTQLCEVTKDYLVCVTLIFNNHWLRVSNSCINAMWLIGMSCCSLWDDSSLTVN
jgi:hypothetical protein